MVAEIRTTIATANADSTIVSVSVRLIDIAFTGAGWAGDCVGIVVACAMVSGFDLNILLSMASGADVFFVGHACILSSGNVREGNYSALNPFPNTPVSMYINGMVINNEILAE